MAKVAVIRKRQIAEALAAKVGSKIKSALAVVDFVFDEIATTVSKGTKVNIKDFGIFVKAERKARMGRNPATGETIKIKASVKPRFSASKTLKEAIKSGKYATHFDEAVLCACNCAKPAAKAAAKPAAKKGKKK